MIGFLLAVGHAWGGPAVGAVIEPNDVVAQYRLHAQEKGVSGPEAELLCKAGVEGIQICASVIQENGWRYATMADEDVVRPTETLKQDGMGFGWLIILCRMPTTLTSPGLRHGRHWLPLLPVYRGCESAPWWQVIRTDIQPYSRRWQRLLIISPRGEWCSA